MTHFGIHHTVGVGLLAIRPGQAGMLVIATRGETAGIAAGVGGMPGATRIPVGDIAHMLGLRTLAMLMVLIMAVGIAGAGTTAGIMVGTPGDMVDTGVTTITVVATPAEDPHQDLPAAGL